MSSVVLRCPSCGTTRAHVGECDACYEAQVRYFCDNHSPGLWLDQPQCKACGARYGDAAERHVPPVPVEPAPVLPRAPPKPRGGLTEPPHASRKRMPGPPETPRPPDLADLIRRALRGRARERYDGAAWGRATPSVARPRLGGCLGRLILFAFIVLVFIVLGMFLLVGGALRFFLGG